MAEAQLARRELAPFDAVVLCNIAQFTEAEVPALEDYLKQGGGVVVFGGDRVVGRELQPACCMPTARGLLPASIGRAVGDARGKKAAFGFNALGYRHPIVGRFADESDAVLAGLTRRRRGSTTSWRSAEDRRPRSPWLRQRRPGRRSRRRGPGDGDPGGDLGRRRLDHLAGAPELPAGHGDDRPAGGLGPARRAERPASASRWTRPCRRPAAAAVTVRGPGKTACRRLKSDGGVSRFGFEETDLAGAYRVKVGPPLSRESTFAANPDPAESDLAKLDRGGLAGAVPGLEVRLPDEVARMTGDAAVGQPQGGAAPPLALRRARPPDDRVGPRLAVRTPRLNP